MATSARDRRCAVRYAVSDKWQERIGRQRTLVAALATVPAAAVASLLVATLLVATTTGSTTAVTWNTFEKG